MEGGLDCTSSTSNIYNQTHGHGNINGPNSEKSSGAKTPKTPSVREGTPNYNERYLSGISSCERTPRVRHSSGEKTPTHYHGHKHRRPSRSPDKSNADSKDLIEVRLSPLRGNDRNRSAERMHGERSSHKRERSVEWRQVYDGDEDETYNNQRNLIVAHPCTRSTSYFDGESKSRSSSPKRHQQNMSLRDASPVKSGHSESTTEYKRHARSKQCRKYEDVSTEEDSAGSVVKGPWDSSPPGMKSELITDSQVSVVQKIVQAQAQALGRYSVPKDNVKYNEWCSDVKKSKTSTKGFTEQKAVAAVLAFQRWRHTQLKKLFSLELKNVLEEAKEDEACLATLEKELAIKDKHLAQLRSELARYREEFQEQINHKQMHELLGANVEELEKECHKALKRAGNAEEVLRKRDVEIIRLRERLKSLDEEGVRVDGDLQANMKLLQREKESALDEGRILLAQLARRDEEVAQQCKEIERLRVTVAQLSEKKLGQQNQVDCMKAEYHAQIRDLQEKLQDANAERHTKETELAAYTERCNGLGQERQNLLVQLHRAVERADLASRRAEELQMKLHCNSEERAKASEDVAGEMAEHLKRLTGHMKELETSVDRNGLIGLSASPGASLQKKAGLAKVSAKLAQAELDALNLISSHTEDHQTDADHERSWAVQGQSTREVDENKRQVCFSLDGKHRRHRDKSTSAIVPFRDEGDTCDVFSIDRDIALTKFKKWTAWKWRWAASATKAENLSKQLRQAQDRVTPTADYVKDSDESFLPKGSGCRERAMGLVKKFESSQFDGDLILPDEEKVETLILQDKIVPLIMAAWRAFARMSSLERKASSRNESLNKIISALPWWIRRVAERRLLERYFFHWQLLALKASRERAHQRSYRKNVVPYSNPVVQFSRPRDRDRGRDSPQLHAQAAEPGPGQARSQSPPSGAVTPLPAAQARDAQVQTATGVISRDRERDGNWKPLSVRSSIRGASPPTSKAVTPRPPNREKSEPHAVVICPTCDIRRKFSKNLLQPPVQATQQAMESKTGLSNNSTFTARALHALQGSLQQELQELHYLLSQEMEEMQQQMKAGEDIYIGAPRSRSLSVKAHGRAADDGQEGNGINRLALKSVFDVCNNLAQVLFRVRSQLTRAENQAPSSTPRGISPAAPALKRNSPWELDNERSAVGKKHPEAVRKDSAWEEGGRSSSISRERVLTSRMPSGSGGPGVTTPRYASPITRDKNVRFASTSPGWLQQQTKYREPWSRFGSPTTIKQLREREARINAPSTLRELREFRARQEREQQQLADENNDCSRSGRQSPQDRDSETWESVREPQQQPPRRVRREGMVRFSQDEAKSIGRGVDYSTKDDAICTSTSKPPPPPPPTPPDYTTVVQILNQENTKIGEVAIHTSAASVERCSDRGGISDLCSGARGAICTEEECDRNPEQFEIDKSTALEHPQESRRPRTPQELAEDMASKSSQPSFRPKSALKLPARGQSAPRERLLSRSMISRPADLNSRMLDDARFLASLRRKCIGSNYADLLKSEILRLREGRLMIEDGRSLLPEEEGGDTSVLSRELVPRSTSLANRPSWKPHYTPPPRCKT